MSVQSEDDSASSLTGSFPFVSVVALCPAFTLGEKKCGFEIVNEALKFANSVDLIEN
jgi:hypothetical protein